MDPQKKKLIRGALALAALLGWVAYFLTHPQKIREPGREMFEHFGPLMLAIGAIFAVVELLKLCFKFSDEWVKRAIEVLALGALFYSFYENYEASAIRKDTQRISERISTRPIGAFPRSLPEITRVVREANTSLTIATDFVGYGHFSAPSDFEAYFRAIVDRSHELEQKKMGSVRMVVYGAAKGAEERGYQFDEIRSSTTRFQDYIAKKWPEYSQYHSTAQRPSEVDALCDQMVRDDQDYRAVLLNNRVQLEDRPGPFPLFVWKSDHAAVFSFVTQSGKGEMAFYTEDPEILKTLDQLMTDNLYPPQMATPCPREPQ